MPNHSLTFVAAALTATVFLTGCVGDEGVDSSTPPTPAPTASSPAPSNTPTATPTPTTGSVTPLPPGATATPPAGSEGSTPSDDVSDTPAPSNGSDDSEPSAEWKTITVDGWATVTIPATWTQEERTGDSPEPGHVIVDQDGNNQVQLGYAERDRKFNPPACIVANDIDKGITISRSEELPEAYPGEQLARVTQIRKIPIWQGEVDGEHKYEDKYSLEVHLFEMDRAAANTECAPYSGIYPDAGGVMTVGIIADPYDALYFNTEEGARRYTESKEYELIEQIIESVRITP